MMRCKARYSVHTMLLTYYQYGNMLTTRDTHLLQLLLTSQAPVFHVLASCYSSQLLHSSQHLPDLGK